MTHTALLFFTLLSACAHSPSPRDRELATDPAWKPVMDSIGPAGGRVSTHGMVLFGSGDALFVEHIPMLHAPHDAQIVAQVEIKKANGNSVTQSFSDATFTFKPDPFSLNDWVSGKRSAVTGSIYRGSFEQDGKIEKGLEKVVVELLEFKLVRTLPSETGPDSFTIEDEFETEIIKSGNNVQRITRLAPTPLQLWCVKGPDFFEPCQN